MRAYAFRMLRLHRGVWLLLANSVGTTLGLAIVLVIYNLYLVALGYHEDFIGTFTAVSALAMVERLGNLCGAIVGEPCPGRG